MNEVTLYKKHLEFHSNLDYIDTSIISMVKEISRRINFASCLSQQQILNNKGNAYYKLDDDGVGDYFNNLTLDYTIKAKELGVVYGEFKVKTDKEGNDKVSFKADKFNGYARFIADIISDKVVYSKEMESFVVVGKNTFEPLNNVSFALNYPVDNRNRIPNFFDAMTELYKEHLKFEHDFKIYPYVFAGNDWVYDLKKLKLTKRPINNDELFFVLYNVEYGDINTDIPTEFIDLISNDDKSKHNLKLMHAYTMMRKVKLVPAEKWFLLKDFGRSGKGLVMVTFQKLLKLVPVNFDNLTNGGFEAVHEWTKFYGADIAHANETGAITEKHTRIMRKISTGEVVTGRTIGKDSITFKNEAVLILDTNEQVDTGEITANKTRTVKISLKDRPKGETDDQRYASFGKYWNFINPNDVASETASVSFLIASLEYLESVDGKFFFNDVALKQFYSADELTESQEIALRVIKERGFILTNDEIYKKAIEQDYGKAQTKRAQEDFKKIGVSVPKATTIGGVKVKIRKIDNEEMFNNAFKLLTTN
ncbi:phage resistance protein [Mammaliicoccus sciuri]|uniref:phage resistance protein n=1 Tax=Mammaliicoccus sciuri TaxID=1296 RepID=UPI00194EF551|nr:phage resistance protein [Mammaliicoccus sciuri]